MKNKIFLIALLLLPALSFAQNERLDWPVTSISSQYAPLLQANVPPNSPVLHVCHSPANQVPCTNYATTFNSLGAACSNGAQDTPQPQPSSCQATGDAQGNVGFWAPPGKYDITICVENNCFNSPYTVTLGSASASGLDLQTNGVDNAVQDELNLLNSTGIHFVDNGDGSVQANLLVGGTFGTNCLLGAAGVASNASISCIPGAAYNSGLGAIQANFVTPPNGTNCWEGTGSGIGCSQAQAVAGTPTINQPKLSGTYLDNVLAPIAIDAVNGTASCPTCAVTVVAAQQGGADWCANVNLADASLGANPGTIWLTQAAVANTCSANITLSANHRLYDASCGTYALTTHSILVSGAATTGSIIQGCGRDVTVVTYTGASSAIAPVVASNNLTRNVHLSGFTLSASTSTGIGIDEHNANSWLIEDFHIKGFNGSGGVCVRVRGDGTTSGAYFDRHYNGFLDNCETAVLINYDTSANIATSFQFDGVHCNVVTNCYDVQGSSGWFRDDYIENVSGIGIRIRATGINNFFRGINLDNNGSAGTGTGVQFDSGGSDTRFQANISGFLTLITNNGANNDFTGSNPVTWHVDFNGNFSTFNALDSDDFDVVRCGLTGAHNCGILYENYNGSTLWWSGQASSGNYAVRSGSAAGNSAIEFDTAGNINLLPSDGIDNALNVNLTAGSASNQNIFLNFVNKGAVQWRWENFSSGTVQFLDAAGCPRLGFQFATNGFSSISGCGTAATNIGFSGSGGTRFGNGDNTTTVATISSTGLATFPLYASSTNCANGGTPAVCAAAATGAVAVPTGSNPTLTVDTSAVTATSRIFLTIDESLTIPTITCNTTISTLIEPVVTARTPGTSFTIEIGATIGTNPACVSYMIVN